MAALLAAKAVPLQAHLLQHIAVAHLGGLEPHAVFFAELLEAQVGHDGAHHGVLVQLAPALHVQGADGHDKVPVHKIARLIHHQAPVRVPVKGHARVQVVGAHIFNQPLHMGGAAVVIHIDAVRALVQHGDLCPQLGKQGLRRGAGRAVGAVNGQLHAVQGKVHGALDVLDIVPHRAVRVGDRAQALVHRQLAGDVRSAQNNVLNPLFQIVRQLEAIPRENLNAVILKGVVGGGNHHPRVRLVLLHQIGHCRGGHHAQSHYAGPNAAKPGGHGILQHIRGEPGVLADENPGVPVGFICQHLCRRPAQLGGQLAGQVLVGNASDSVCSKKPSHKNTFLF